MSGPAKDFVRGSISNRPFRPGGLDDSQSLERTLPDGASSGEWVHQLLIGGPAQAIPPSFKQGLDLGYLQVNLIATLIESCKIKNYSNYNIDTELFWKAYPCSWNVYKDHSSVKSASDEKLVSFFVFCFFFQIM